MSAKLQERYRHRRSMAKLEHSDVDFRLGVDEGTSQAVEEGRKRPGPAFLGRCAFLFDCQTSDLDPSIRGHIASSADTFGIYTIALAYPEREAEALWGYAVFRGRIDIDGWVSLDEERLAGLISRR